MDVSNFEFHDTILVGYLQTSLEDIYATTTICEPLYTSGYILYLFINYDGVYLIFI